MWIFIEVRNCDLFNKIIRVNKVCENLQKMT